MLDLNYDLTLLKGADYNPRKIDDNDLKVLQESVRTLGVVKPIIARGETIVAGHQRSKALRANGQERGPVFLLSIDANFYDEIRFNQLHNGTEMDCGEENCTIGEQEVTGQFVQIKPSAIKANMRSKLANVRSEIASLIVKFGPWGACVATQSGEVIHCAQYALAAKSTNTPLTAFIIKDEDRQLYDKYLNKQYGVFSYDKLERNTFIQTLAQMHRLSDGKRAMKSSLYTRLVIPYMEKNPTLRAIDFGSGYGAYAKRLRAEGYDIHDVELFRKAKGRMGALDITAINKMITTMCESLKTLGKYDVVICDSVFNSVDCHRAEKSVAHVLNALCKKGGAIFISGRPVQNIKSRNNMTKMGSSATRRVEFMDEDNYTALYRKGNWFYQKFHSDKQLYEHLLPMMGARQIKRSDGGSSNWSIHCEKDKEINNMELGDAVDYEFNLPLNKKGRTINRHEDVKDAFGI